MFDPLRVLRAILNTLALAPLGAGISVIAVFRSDYQGSLKGHYDHSLLSSTCAWYCLVVTKPLGVTKVVIHSRLRLRRCCFKVVTWQITDGSLGKNLRWLRGRPQETYHLPSQNSQVTIPDRLFLGPYGDSRRATATFIT